jgi:hypothetical protein
LCTGSGEHPNATLQRQHQFCMGVVAWMRECDTRIVVKMVDDARLRQQEGQSSQ